MVAFHLSSFYVNKKLPIGISTHTTITNAAHAVDGWMINFPSTRNTPLVSCPHKGGVGAQWQQLPSILSTHRLARCEYYMPLTYPTTSPDAKHGVIRCLRHGLKSILYVKGHFIRGRVSSLQKFTPRPMNPIGVAASGIKQPLSGTHISSSDVRAFSDILESRYKYSLNRRRYPRPADI